MPFIDDLKKANRVEDLAREYGATFVGEARQSGEWSACCPCHTEATPSFSVNTDKQVWNCFVCGGGSVIELVMKHDQCDYSTAVKALAARGGVAIPEDIWSPKSDALMAAAEAYHKSLTPEGRAYLNSRGITDGTIDKFLIGECTGKTVDFGVTITDLVRAGIATKDKKGDPHHYFAGRITIPHWHGGKVINMTGRALAPVTKKDRYRKLPKEFVQQDLFNLDAASTETPILCEGEMDCISLLQAGFNAVAVTGVRCFTTDQAARFAKCKKVYVLFDSDGAGQENARVVAALLGDKALNVTLPTGAEDVNELLVKDCANFTLSIAGMLVSAKPFVIDPSDAEELKLIQGPFTDVWNGEFFVNMYRGKIVLCEKLGGWFIWDGAKWLLDSGYRMQSLASQATQRMLSLATKHGNRDLEKHAVSSQSVGSLEAMIKVARGLNCVRSESQFDIDPFLLNLPNGTFDLRKNAIQPAAPEDLITRQSPTQYTKAAECPAWKVFISEIFEGNTRVIHYVQKALGYALSGDVCEQSMFFLFGQGANGKSTLLKHVLAILGDGYAINTPPSTFLNKFGEGISNDLARLKGIRLIVAEEPSSVRTLSESVIKQFTGGDTITARFMFREFFSFKPSGKIFIAANHRPEVNDTGHGMWRRIRAIPFNRVFKEIEQDRTLDARLETEHEGILNWLIEGFQLWAHEGLGMIPEIEDTVASYREENDLLAEFVKERCDLDSGGWVISTTLQSELLMYARAKGDLSWRKGRLFSGLRAMNFKYEVVTWASPDHGKHVWRGLRLKSTAPEVSF